MLTSQILTGVGLAIAAGPNAYILVLVLVLVLGLAGRFLSFVALPDNWSCFSNPWVLAILGVLLLIENIAGKIPFVESLNDILRTVVRPVASGIAFGTAFGTGFGIACGTGAGSAMPVVKDPASFFTSGSRVPVAVGVLIALTTHLTKSAARPVINVATIGTATAVVSTAEVVCNAEDVSTAEDVSSVALILISLLIPIRVGVVILGVMVGIVIVMRPCLQLRRELRAEPGPTATPSGA